MFDLEKKISDWRQQMLAAGIRSPVPLEELEIHLREEIERQMKAELNGQEAFEFSLKQVGLPEMLEVEFDKNERIFMSQSMKTTAGIIGLVVGMALVVPGTMQLRHELVMATSRLGLWMLGWAMVSASAILLQRMLWPKLFKVELENVQLERWKQGLKIGAGITVLLMGAALWLPAATQAVQNNAVNFEAICFLTFGGALLITGAVVTFCPYKKRAA